MPGPARHHTAARPTAWLVAACCLAAGGCGEGQFYHRCEYDGIAAVSSWSNWPGHHPPYRHVEFEPAKMKQVNGSAFSVLLPDGHVRRSSDLTESLVKRLGAELQTNT